MNVEMGRAFVGWNTYEWGLLSTIIVSDRSLPSTARS
jgi:hypothetical protein